MKHTISFIKYILVILSIFIILSLIIFEDKITDYFESPKLSAVNTDTAVGTTESYITVPDESLEYNGTASLNYMDGVSATDADGSDITEDISVQVISGDAFNKKTVVYSVMDSNSQLITKERTIILYNYEGPSIEIDESVDFNDYDLSSIISSLIADGLLSATDGYGNDISDNICFFYSLLDSETSLYQVTFSICNEFGDMDSILLNANLYSIADGPSVTLKQSSVTISIGSEFDPMEYVDSAIDENGEDISDYVSVNGNINLSKAGQYTMNYSVTNKNGEISPSVTLIVYVR